MTKAPDIQAVRRFNRFYTRRIGILSRHWLNTPFSLTESRVLYEIANHERATASVIGKDLGLDPGYLSRILLSFEKRSLLSRKTSARDARQSDLSLTRKGRNAFAPLDLRSNEEVAAMLEKLTDPAKQRLVEAMIEIERLLGDGAKKAETYVLRSHQPGDIGWVVHRHGVIYSQEYGWDEQFEALVAEIASKFIQNFDPKRERCWIAERAGEIAGSIFLVRETSDVAKLRLLLVEPSARGLGIGKRLVDECVCFARQARYRKITLWTQSILQAARHIYLRAGFHLVSEEPNQAFGNGLTSQHWELDLTL